MKVLAATQPYTIIRGVVGSTIHGLHIGDQDDRDEMGVAVEPPEFVIGLARAKFERDGKYQQGFEHIVERTQPEAVVLAARRHVHSPPGMAVIHKRR